MRQAEMGLKVGGVDLDEGLVIVPGQIVMMLLGVAVGSEIEGWEVTGIEA